MNLNQVNIIGRVTKKPLIKALPSGTKIVNFGVATNRTWTQDGAKKEEVEFINVVAFSKLAEIIDKYVEKGQLIYIQGRLKTSNWEKDGAKHYKTEVIAESMQMGPKASGEKIEKKEEVEEEIKYPTEEVNPEDIPF